MNARSQEAGEIDTVSKNVASQKVINTKQE